MHGGQRGLPDDAADREREARDRKGPGGHPLIRALALGAVLAWTLGALAMPMAAWIWIRSSRRRWVLVAFAAGLVAQIAWLREVATRGLSAVLVPDAGLTAWGAWSLGVAGLVALFSGLGPVLRRGGQGLADPDRALEIAIGFFGLGVLLRQIALALS